MQLGWMRLVLLAAPLLAGCQFSDASGVYRVWLDWRTPLQPAMVFERNRLAHGGTGRTVVVNWDDRHFIDPRYTPDPAARQSAANLRPPVNGDSRVEPPSQPVPEPTEDPQPQSLPSGSGQALPVPDAPKEGPVAVDPAPSAVSHIPNSVPPSQAETAEHSAEAGPVIPIPKPDPPATETPSRKSSWRLRNWSGFAWGAGRLRS